MKVIIAGSRPPDFARTPEGWDAENVWFDEAAKAIETAVAGSGFEITEVVSGTARGIDTLGEMWAAENRLPVKRFHPKWHGPLGQVNKRAGFDRNEQMANYADALIAIWDGQSRGTKHMIEAMKQRNKPAVVTPLAMSMEGEK